MVHILLHLLQSMKAAANWRFCNLWCLFQVVWPYIWLQNRSAGSPASQWSVVPPTKLAVTPDIAVFFKRCWAPSFLKVQAYHDHQHLRQLSIFQCRSKVAHDNVVCTFLLFVQDIVCAYKSVLVGIVNTDADSSINGWMFEGWVSIWLSCCQAFSFL